MQYLIVTALLAALAAAAPAAQKQRIFGLTALRSASPIHFREINANGEGFWIGKPTKTYCPKEPGLPCPPNTNTTLFSQYGSTTGLGLDTEVPAGQEGEFKRKMQITEELDTDFAKHSSMQQMAHSPSI